MCAEAPLSSQSQRPGRLSAASGGPCGRDNTCRHRRTRQAPRRSRQQSQSGGSTRIGSVPTGALDGGIGVDNPRLARNDFNIDGPRSLDPRADRYRMRAFCLPGLGRQQTATLRIPQRDRRPCVINIEIVTSKTCYRRYPPSRVRPVGTDPQFWLDRRNAIAVAICAAPASPTVSTMYFLGRRATRWLLIAFPCVAVMLS